MHPIGRQNRKGKWGSPYAIRDFYKIDPNLGSKTDLHDLVQQVHTHDMRIIMDLVANHTARDHIWTNNNPNIFSRDRQGNFTRLVADWYDINDLNYHDPETADYMMDVLTYWVKTFDIDGYRCDVAGMVPLDFWEKAISKLTEIKQDIFLLAEWESSRLHLNAFHAYYDWTLYLLLKEISQGKRPAADALKWIQQRQRLFPSQTLPMRFTENHDFARTRDTFGSEGFYPYAALIFAIKGLPLLYAGQEIGLHSAPSLFEREPLDWENNDNEVFNFYKRMIQLRQTYPALSARELQILPNDHPSQVLSFIKKTSDQEMLVLLNFSDRDLQVRIEPVRGSQGKRYINLISGKGEYSVRELRYVNLKAFGVLFLNGISN
jgi:glycosidase